MDTVMKPVQNGRGRRRQWSGEQKLTVLQEWQTGVPLEDDLPGLIWSRMKVSVRLDRNQGGHGHAQETVHTRRGHSTSADG